MLKVALTGGLASGKSLIARHFEQLGCLRIDADALGHAVLASNGEAYTPVLNAFGSGILDEEGNIVRRRLAALVFDHPERLAVLNQLVHPPVRARTEHLLADFAAREPNGIAVVEAAIHIETGGYRLYDRLVLAWCRREQQIERAMSRDHASRQEVEARLARQMPLDEKRNFAHYVIDTSGTIDDTIRQTKEVYLQLRSLQQ